VEKLTLDLNAAGPDNRLQEFRTITGFAAKTQALLTDLYLAGFNTPISIRGTRLQIDKFFNALKSEKRYMDAYLKHGLGDNRTMRNQHELNRSIEAFERETNLKWPFKN